MARAEMFVGRLALLCSGALGLFVVAAAAAEWVSPPSQTFTGWPAEAFCAVRRSSLTVYEQRLIERRTTRLQARRAAMAGSEPL